MNWQDWYELMNWEAETNPSLGEVPGPTQSVEPSAVLERPASPEPVLIDAKAVASLLGISLDAVYMRVSRAQIPGVVKTGRRTQFHKATLLGALERKARR